MIFLSENAREKKSKLGNKEELLVGENEEF